MNAAPTSLSHRNDSARLIVHHLSRSQSERIVWLAEELGLDYELRRYERRKDNRLAPPEYKALHPLGAAPVITHGDLVLGESAAIVEYLLTIFGEGRLAVSSSESTFSDYLYWFHFASGTLQPALLRVFYLELAKTDPNHPGLIAARERFDLALSALDDRLAPRAAVETPWLAGSAFTAADIMTVFSLTTMRLYRPFDLSPWPNLVAYLARIGERPAYRRAMQKGDPDLLPLLRALP